MAAVFIGLWARQTQPIHASMYGDDACAHCDERVEYRVDQRHCDFGPTEFTDGLGVL